MALLKLPYELRMEIARALECRDLNTLVQCHPFLYNTFNDDLYKRNVQHHNTSALFWAASTGSESTLQRLLDAGANVQWESQYLACSLPCVRTRLRIRAEGMKLHPISYAATYGHVQIVIRLLDLGVDINYRDPDGLSPLALAARKGHFALVRILVTRGAKLLSHDTEGKYPPGHAASNGHYVIEDYLFDELRKYPYKRTDPGLDLYWMLKYAAGQEEAITIAFDISYPTKGRTSTSNFLSRVNRLYAALSNSLRIQYQPRNCCWKTEPIRTSRLPGLWLLQLQDQLGRNLQSIWPLSEMRVFV